MNTTNETTEMLRRRIALQEQEVKDEYWLDVSTAELRAILDAYAALRDERDALRTRLAAAEKVVETVFDMDPFDDTTQLNVLGMADNYVRQFKVGEKP